MARVAQSKNKKAWTVSLAIFIPPPPTKQTRNCGKEQTKLGQEKHSRNNLTKSSSSPKTKKLNPSPAIGEGILCEVTKIVGESKQRRYEIRDIDPEGLADPVRASLNQMTPIPPKNEKIPDLPPKKAVLALYPNTTTFYKAEVVKCDLERQIVRLRFEGEEDPNSETEVERRYVLVDWTGK